MPRPRFKATPEHRAQVSQLAALGVPYQDIAAIIGIASKNVLIREFRTELDVGVAKANARVAQRLFEIATAGEPRNAVPACIFWLKTRARWKETQDVNITSEGPSVDHLLSLVESQYAPEPKGTSTSSEQYRPSGG